MHSIRNAVLAACLFFSFSVLPIVEGGCCSNDLAMHTLFVKSLYMILNGKGNDPLYKEKLTMDMKKKKDNKDDNQEEKKQDSEDRKESEGSEEKGDSHGA